MQIRNKVSRLGADRYELNLVPGERAIASSRRPQTETLDSDPESSNKRLRAIGVPVAAVWGCESSLLP